MKSLTNLHTHTYYVDGKNSPSEMAQKAYSLGFKSLGFSEHGHTPCDLKYSLSQSEQQKYFADVMALKKEYQGRMQIFLGLEIDQSYPYRPDELDYTLGSMHYIFYNNKAFAIDASFDQLKTIVESVFNGDAIALVNYYYKNFTDFIIDFNPSIVGHYDLITKFNNNVLFNENSIEYKNIAIEGINNILNACPNIVFEVNTGAMARINKSSPYPNKFLLKHLIAKGAKLCISSDCHNMNFLNHQFLQTEAMLKQLGNNCLYELNNGNWQAYII